MKSNIYDEENTMIMIPGPIEFHPSITRAMSKKVYGHRTKFFRTILEETHERLKKLFGIEKGEVLSMAGSGTLAMDAALRSLSSDNDIILNLVCGKFSHRFLEIAKTVKHKEIITERVNAELEWGKVFTADRVKEIMDKCEDLGKDPSIVTLCHNETSTGVIHDVEEIARIIKKRASDPVVIVDGITSVGAVPIRMEDWCIDIYVAGSQKCLETPPGLAFVALSERSIEIVQRMTGKSKLKFENMNGYYNHIAVYLDAWIKKRDLPFTSAVSLYYALNMALDNIFKEGLDKRFHRIRIMSNILREAMRSMGLKLLLEDVDNVDISKYASPTVTAVSYPPKLAKTNNVDREFRSIVRRMGILIAGGQSKLKGKIFRLATMARVGPREIITVVSVIEYALRRLGYKPERSGIITAMESMEKLKIDEKIS